MAVSGTVKGLISRQHAFLQPRRHSKNLGRGARLISIADAEIPPEGIPGNLGPIRNHIIPAEIIQNLIFRYVCSGVPVCKLPLPPFFPG